MSCRGTCGGLNGPDVDLNLLRANRLYGGLESAAAARRLILENAEKSHWLIFYSHDVAVTPSRYGCTPGLLETICSFAARRGARFMTVAQVMEELGQKPRTNNLEDRGITVPSSMLLDVNSMADTIVAVPPLIQEPGVSTNCYLVDPIGDPRWAALVNSHPRASVFHTQNWLRALRDVYGYESVVVTTCSPSERLTNGVVFCRVKSWLTGHRLVSLPFSDHCEPLIDNRDELDAILLQMTRQIEAGEWRYVEIRPITCEPSFHAELSRFDTYHLHRLDLV